MEKQVIVLQSMDPFWNLAAEEHLFDTLPEMSSLLLLYVNGPAVVVGKHQNPWLEVDLSELERRHIPLLRRISGGGTVFHDPGNVNFALLGPRNGFDRRGNLLFVCDVLSKLGVSASISDKYDLYAGGMKISGNAFCFRRNHALHHGTLLVSTDLSSFRPLLSPPDLRIETHAVRSRPARTINLSEIEPEITPSLLIDALTEDYGGNSNPVFYDENSLVDEAVASFCSRNHTWDWIYGRTPDFSVTSGLSNGAAASVRIKKGRVAEVTGSDEETAELLALLSRMTIRV